MLQSNLERCLIKPKDKIVAMLLFELGNLSILNNNIKDAKELFLKAKEYGLENEILNKRLNYVAKKLNLIVVKVGKQKHISRVEKMDYVKPIILIGIILSVLLGIILVLRRKKDKNTINKILNPK